MLQNIKSFGLAFYILLGVVALQTNLAVAQPLSSTNVTEAGMVANQYMQALMEGDTEIVRSLLVDDALTRKSSMLSNPTYSGFLQRIYSNAQFQILNAELRSSGNIIADVLVTYSSQETIKFRLWLKSVEKVGMRIFSETELH